MADCNWIDLGCKGKEFLASSIGDALTKTADAVLEAAGKALASLGTVWVNIGTPTLTGGGGSSGVTPGATADGGGGINTVLGWATYIAFGICVVSLIWLGVRMATGRRHEARDQVSRFGLVLVATILISAAVAVVTAIVPAVRSNGSPAVAYIQDSLWFYMIAVAVLSVIVGAARMAWEQRAEPGRDLVKSLMTLVVVSGAGLTAVSLLTAAGDSFAIWLLDGALGCNVTDTSGTCFGGNMAALLVLTNNPVTGGLGAILVIVLGLFAVLGSMVQILLMIVRAGMLVVLAGVLPLSAAATNTETGRTMFRKTTGWLLAFVLYKPVAAIVYATAFKLAGTSIFKDDGTGLISILVGLTLMAVALVAMPALMILIAPAVSAVSSGGGLATAAAAGAAAAIPTGAIAGGRLRGGGGGSSSGASGSDGSKGSSGSSTSGPSGSSGGSGSTGSPAANGSARTGATGAQGAGTAGAASGGAAAGGAAAGGGAAAAGAAAGPVGAAVQVGTKTIGVAKDTVQGAAETSSGEGGPNGSR